MFNFAAGKQNANASLLGDLRIEGPINPRIISIETMLTADVTNLMEKLEKILDEDIRFDPIKNKIKIISTPISKEIGKLINLYRGKILSLRYIYRDYSEKQNFKEELKIISKWSSILLNLLMADRDMINRHLDENSSSTFYIIDRYSLALYSSVSTDINTIHIHNRMKYNLFPGISFIYNVSSLILLEDIKKEVELFLLKKTGKQLNVEIDLAEVEVNRSRMIQNFKIISKKLKKDNVLLNIKMLEENKKTEDLAFELLTNIKSYIMKIENL